MLLAYYVLITNHLMNSLYYFIKHICSLEDMKHSKTQLKLVGAFKLSSWKFISWIMLPLIFALF